MVDRNIPRYGDDDHDGIKNSLKANFIWKKKKTAVLPSFSIVLIDCEINLGDAVIW